MLIGLAAGGQDVVVLAHGFFNVLIGRALRKRGWRLVESEGYKYWSTRRFERLVLAVRELAIRQLPRH